MNRFSKLALAFALGAAAITTGNTAMAQTTDGFHSIQVFPVVVDSASFAQRFTFRNPNGGTVTISATYFPGGGAQTTALNCGTFTVAAGSDRTFSSLRSICPTLAAGSEFGYLYTYEIDAANNPYSAFSRVSNPQGNGFSVEAFAANEFTSATSTVTGIRRMAATAFNPAFQTNCFVGVMNDITGPATATTPIIVSVFNSAGTQVGTSTSFNIIPGTLLRLLDVFAAVGAPAGDYVDARVVFSENLPAGEPGVMSMCTTQDNTSFGADFRIAKQEGPGGGSNEIGPQDDYNLKDATIASDILMDTGATPLNRPFTIPAGFQVNTHVVYFRHPDWVQCEIINPSTGVRALAAYGLEMRMFGQDGTTVIAGGDENYGFGEIYLGDKYDRNSGANSRYTIEVESTATNTAASRPYYLRCRSGSGHTMGDVIRIENGTDRF